MVDRVDHTGGLTHGLRTYSMIVAMWVRSTMTYRASFALTAFGNFVATAFDFVAILLMFSHIDALGGYTLGEIAFLYGTTSTSFGLADLAMGSMNRLGRRVRDGTLDTLLVRPAPSSPRSPPTGSGCAGSAASPKACSSSGTPSSSPTSTGRRSRCSCCR